MPVCRPWVVCGLAYLRRTSATTTSFKITKRAFVSRAPQQATGSHLTLNSDIPIKEELISGYKPESFYPVNPGFVFHDRYKTIVKVGWGTCSAVWLAQDLNRQLPADRYVILKVNNCDFSDKESAEHELQISRHLAEANPSHNGSPLVRNTIDSFEALGPHGSHIILVYEPMRESLRLFRRHFPDRKLPIPLFKGYLQMLLMWLDYLHSECRIIHTDLKLDNILMGFEDPSVIQDFVQGQAENPMARKVANNRTIYQSHNDFGPLRSLYILPKIADFGLAQRGDSSQLHLHPIQPDHYRAPEVILGTGWTYSTDIWNLGVLIWNLLENRDLFTKVHSAGGQYSSHAHIAEIIALIGPPPKKLIAQEAERRAWKWQHAIISAEGQLCDTANAYYGGPFFDSKGEFIRKDLIPSDLHLMNTITSLEGDEKGLFLAFISKMLQWLPENRKTARELLDDPWLNV